MIHEAINEQYRAIRLPDSADFADRATYEQARGAYSDAQAEVTQSFAAHLADEYLSDIPEDIRAAVGTLTFNLAWEHGHSSGCSDVENYYIDFADFALKVYTTATS